MTESTASTKDSGRWQFWIDVGGTFTDCVACSPRGELLTAKVLSSSAIKGRVREAAAGAGPREIVDPERRGEKDDFYRGYELILFDAEGRAIERRLVSSFDGRRGAIRCDAPLTCLEQASSHELRSPEEAPLLAIRRILGLRLEDPVGSIDLRLGTTRGTNALLERKGARTAFVTTEGFGDVLYIGYQDRPRLFDLAIRKPPPLFERAVEVRERLAADGAVLEPLDLDDARAKLEELRRDGVESLAIGLLHSYRNPRHEEALGRLAEELGFPRVCLSSRAAPTVKLVPRGDTAVVEAYLTPVLEDYVERLRRAAPSSRLRLLTSAGGLAAPGSFRGVDSILSGPAGGVVGVGRVAEAAGVSKAIGFDMGGTSTDVSRYDGSFEMQYETRKAGARIVAPLLGIETVAAGGGSICGFDGERMTVGPESAGARPGPACYGAGGPLTITDVNFFLGRVSERRFPFPLDRRAVERRLEEVGRRLLESGHSRSLVDIASGFLDIANSRMAAAIRRISVARGYDVREYVLVAFGGAGAQHACAVAAELGMDRVLVPGLAGLLSAYGAGLADTRKFVERSVLRTCYESTLGELEPVFATMEREARERVLADGIEPETVDSPRRFLEMRYLGQDSTLTVELGDADPRESFEEAHRRYYGYVHGERGGGRDVEIVTARVECVGRSADATRVMRIRDAPPPRRSAAEVGRPVFFDGREMSAREIDPAALSPGERIAGPAIISYAYHTVVVEPGWRASINERGELEMGLVGEAPSSDGTADKGSGTELDPVRLEIFHQHFAAIAEEMGLVLRRSALSTNVRERLDYSCAVFDPRGDLVANAPHIPVHLGALGDCVKHVARDLPDLAPGDVIVTNDPFRGGSHLPDITVVTPVFETATDRRLFYVASRAHHAEIGGLRPGSMPPDSKNLEEEGVLVRSFRVVERGTPRFDALRRLLEEARYPSRAPGENIADIEAQVAANRAGVRLLLRLIETRGADTVLAYMRHIQEAARRLMENRLAALPPGTSRFVDYLDDGSPLAVGITVADRRAEVDFTGTGRVLQGNLNATPAIVSSAVLYCFRLLLGGDIPLNAGVLGPVHIVLPECFLSPPAAARPADCAAVSGGNVETSQRIVDAVLGALGVAAASQGTMNNLLFGNERFSYYETLAGGAGAGPDFDGADAVHTHMTNTRITDAEILESRYPVRLRRFSIRRGSGGEGVRRGGDGVIRELEFLEDVEISIVSQRRARPPYGGRGGSPGAPGRNLLRSREGAWRELEGITTLAARPGDVLRIETPGGGGYGVEKR